MFAIQDILFIVIQVNGIQIIVSGKMQPEYTIKIKINRCVQNSQYRMGLTNKAKNGLKHGTVV